VINAIKLERAATTLPPHGWQLLPMRFYRLGADSVVLTNLVGEHLFVTPDELVGVAEGTCADQDLLARLRAAHLIQVPGETLPAELLAIKLRTRMRRLPDSTGLHIFVVTLRCEHTCRYCQVSRQSAAKSEFDMTEETARRALELAFRSPSPYLKIEFQGGEPLLNFPLARWITAEAKRMNAGHGKDLAFVIATNLALLDDEVLRRPGRADGPGDDRPRPAKFGAGLGRPRRLPARACRGGRHTRDGRDPGTDLQPPALRPRPAPLAVRGPLDQRLEERLPGYLPLLLGPRHMRRRLHNKRQPPQPAPAPSAMISTPGSQ